VAFADARKGDTLAVVEVLRTERIGADFMRVTVGGDDLRRMPQHGFDHWFRMFLPREEGATSFALPNRVDLLGYLRYKRMPAATRPHLRNYTAAEFRHGDRELDIDFVVHGDEGVASRWVQRTRPGDVVALIDQGRGYDGVADAAAHVLACDETGLPAVAGILRDLPRDAVGVAHIEVGDAGDVRGLDAPDGFTVHWLVRREGDRPASLALRSLRTEELPDGPLSVYAVGEQHMPGAARRHLVAQGVPKERIVFLGYWKQGARAA